MTTAELTAKAKELKQFKLILEETQKEIKRLEEEIKAEMIQQNLSKLILDSYKISYTPVLSVRFNSTKFKQEQPELYAQYAEEKETFRFTLT